jgi:hypothetical protein
MMTPLDELVQAADEKVDRPAGLNRIATPKNCLFPIGYNYLL